MPRFAFVWPLVVALAACSEQPAAAPPGASAADVAPAGSASGATAAAPSPPQTARAAMDAGSEQDLALVATVTRAGAPAKARYAALRRLEELCSPRAVPAALKLLEAEDAFLRTNAIAFLARSKDPRAAQALAGLEPRHRQLAAHLRRRREANE